MTTLGEDFLKDNPALRRPVVPAERDVYNLNSTHPSFLLEDSASPADMAKPAHWSIAWSDLMMTMFILFLSLFVYQSAQQEFLAEQSNEIVSGTTTEAFDVISETDIPSPFDQTPKLSFTSAGTLPTATPQKELGNIKEQVDNIEEVEQRVQESKPLDSTKEVKQLSSPSLPSVVSEKDKDSLNQENIRQKNLALLLPDLPKTEELAYTASESTTAPAIETDTISKRSIAKDVAPQTDDIYPRPITDEPPVQITPQVKSEPKIKPVLKKGSHLNDLFALSKKVVGSNNLDQFAMVDLVPDKTVRIILTGDLLFELGASDLSHKALRSLTAITQTIKSTPYMINIVGHTDNIPMSSGRYPSNWELSVARASSVARFLIDEMNINPNQIAVSGYASYRPIKSNTTAANRAANRRVEIIVTKRLPKPLQTDGSNLN